MKSCILSMRKANLHAELHTAQKLVRLHQRHKFYRSCANHTRVVYLVRARKTTWEGGFLLIHSLNSSWFVQPGEEKKWMAAHQKTRAVFNDFTYRSRSQLTSNNLQLVVHVCVLCIKNDYSPIPLSPNPNPSVVSMNLCRKNKQHIQI